MGTFFGEKALGGAKPAGPSPAAQHFLSQVHCISTEFTPRKHGGEKGVPFRVQIDTFKQNENGEYTEHLHSASCQIKVFKVGRPRHACHGLCPQTRLLPRTPIATPDILTVSRGSPARSLNWAPACAHVSWDGVLHWVHPSASSIACVCAHI